MPPAAAAANSRLGYSWVELRLIHGICAMPASSSLPVKRQVETSFHEYLTREVVDMCGTELP